MRILARAIMLGALSVSAIACSASPDDDGVASEELTGGGNFADGDAVVTTSRLNLRASPSTQADVLTILPFGASLTVSEPEDGAANPSGSFFHVEYGGQSGWAHGSWLARAGSHGGTNPGQSSAPSGGAAQCMAKMARAATSVDGEGSGGRCYHYVKEHIGRALGIGFDGVQSMVGGNYQLNAYDFARWVATDRAANAGFVRANIPLDQLPLGAILVWRPGQCGYSSSAGHIETNIGNGRACSDFCGHIKTTCGAPTVVVYQKGC